MSAMPDVLDSGGPEEWEGWKEDEAERVLAFRIRIFMDDGFSYPEALELAAAPVDHHTLEKMLKAGCPAELARKILL